MVIARVNEAYVNGNVEYDDERTLGDDVGLCGEVRTKKDNKPVHVLILKTEEKITKENDDSKICKCKDYEGIILTSERAYDLCLGFEMNFGKKLEDF